MYRVNTIIASWLGLNAWRQQYDVNGEQLEADLLTGSSGMYYQDEHPMLTLENLKSIMPDYSLVNYPAHTLTANYLTGNIVKSGGINYIAIQDNINQAVTQAAYWKVFKPLNNWLKQKTEAAIIDTIVAFQERKEMAKTAKTLLENKTLFDGIGRISNVIPNRDRRAGFEIVTSRSMGLTARLDRIGLQFDANGSISIQLHHSSKETPLQTLILAYTRAKSIQWFDLAWDLPHVSDDVDSGGAYYVTYKQSALPGQAIKKEKEWNEAPCESCTSTTEINTWKTYSRYMEFHPFNVPEVATDNLWDITDNRYDYSSNQGLNFAISLYCDYTNFFVEQKDLFKSVLRKQVAINLLRELAYNPNSRISQTESTVTREQLIYEIDGDTRGRKTGIGYKYNLAMDAIALNVEGLHRVCLPCKKKGVKYKTT